MLLLSCVAQKPSTVRARLIFMLVAEHLRDFQARIEIMKTLCNAQPDRHTKGNNFLILFQIHFVIEATYSFYQRGVALEKRLI